MTRGVRIAVVLVACGAAASAAGVGASMVLSANSSQDSSGTQTQPAPVTVDPLVSRSLALFRRPRGAPDAHAAAIALSPRAQALGANRDLARLALTTRDGDQVYLVPGANSVCFLSSKGRESACTDAVARALSGPRDAIVCSPTLPPGQVEVYGTLADGARDVVVTFDDGSKSPVQVEGNAFVITAARKAPLPRTVEWDSADGHHVADTGVPADAADSKCAGS